MNMPLRTSRSRKRTRSPAVKTARRLEQPLADAFVLATLLLGGTGLTYPWTRLVVILLALAVLAVRLPKVDWGTLDGTARAALWLLAATFLLPLLQAIPLPRGLWSALPGHQIAAQIAQAAGGVGWTAWSLSPDRTLEAVTPLVPVAAGFLLAAEASGEQRRRLLRIVLVVALVSAAIAIVQLGAGPDAAPVLFGTRHRGFGVGFFVNRNHLALFLLIAMQIAALPGIPGPLRRVENPKAVEWGLRVAAFVLLTLGVLATLSRAGVFLLAPALTAALLISRGRRVKPLLLLGGVVGASLLAFALRNVPIFASILQRFSTAAEDKRFEYWVNTVLALRDALPLGTGFGTFTLVYPTYEPLNQIAPDVVNHAHNDLLELVLEAGIPGAALLLAWLAFIVYAAVRARKAETSRRRAALPLVVVIAVVLSLLASIVDYPVRMSAVAVTLALLVGFIVPLRATRSTMADPRPKPARAGWIWWAPLALVGVFACSTQTAAQLVDSGVETAAPLLAPWSSQAQSAAATRYETLGEVDATGRAARRALSVSPLDPAALRAEGMAAAARGEADRSAALMSLGARLGWRDAITQLWLIEHALAAGADGFAVQRIDAMLRQQRFVDELLPYLPRLLRTESGRAALAEQLAFNPGWRTAFFNTVAHDKGWSLPELLDLMQRLRRAGSPATPEQTALIRAVLADTGGFAEGRRIWLASGGTGLLGDGEFEAAPGQVPDWGGPFVWRAPPLVGLRLQIATPDVPLKGNAVAIDSQGISQGPALAQTVVLPAGRYTVTLSALSKTPGVIAQLGLGLGCRYDARGPLAPPIPVPLRWSDVASGWQTARGSVNVPADCPAQDLMLVVSQQGGRPFSVWVDGVSIRSASQPGA